MALGNEPCALADEPHLPPDAACAYVAINDFDGDGSNDRLYTYVLQDRGYARARLASGRVTAPLDLGTGAGTRLVRAADVDSDGRAEARVITGSGPVTLEMADDTHRLHAVCRSGDGELHEEPVRACKAAT